MASGFFAVLDDIAALMDDVALASKLATKKTAGILGDDLAVNAEKATGFVASRELPVLWAITKGSFVNKLIILPIAFLLTFFFPKAIILILLAGGLYLAYEGAEKIIHVLIPKTKQEITTECLKDVPQFDEKAKIKSAITTDFILSIEIVIIALGEVMQRGSSLIIQIVSVSIVAIIATIGVYGIVGLIVRMDDLGEKIKIRSSINSLQYKLGTFLIKSLPFVIKFLGVVGTIALLLVSGGIIEHNIHIFHNVMPQIPRVIVHFILGLVAGLLIIPIVKLIKIIFIKIKNAA